MEKVLCAAFTIRLIPWNKKQEELAFSARVFLLIENKTSDQESMTLYSIDLLKTVYASNSRLYPSVRNFHGIDFISSNWKNYVCINNNLCHFLSKFLPRYSIPWNSMVFKTVEKISIKIDTNYGENLIFSFVEIPDVWVQSGIWRMNLLVQW